jgi:hypothetical protein
MRQITPEEDDGITGLLRYRNFSLTGQEPQGPGLAGNADFVAEPERNGKRALLTVHVRPQDRG